MINFTKMHGIGNDFVIIENSKNCIPNKHQFARDICNRHFGVGADGLILIYPSLKANVKIEIFNSDGSEASMCGNGVRCVCKYLVDTHTCSGSDIIDIETKSGIKHITCENKGDFIANVDMGIPSFSVDSMGLKTDKATIYDYPLTISHGTFNITCVYIGNIHTVIFVDSLWLTPIEEIALQIQKNNMFLNGTNVEFVEVISNSELKVRVFERGCGETLACGTGACAAAFAAIRIKNLSTALKVELPGGILDIHFDEKTSHIYLSGTAKTVFKGKFYT